MDTIVQTLKSGKSLVSDGAWGTFLQARGLQAGDCPELWNVEHSDVVLEIAKSYVDAGANMIETNSFGGSRFKLANYGLEDRAYELNKAAAELSKKAAGDSVYVLGSVGPTGKILMMGEVTPEELYEAFKEQATALADGGADAIIIETMSDLEEAKIAIKAAKENTDCEVICTMTFEKTVDGEYRSMMGVSPTQMAEELVPAGIDVFGANCGNGSEGMVNIVKEIRESDKKLPILIHANAGMPEYKDGATVFPESPEEMAVFTPKLIEAGANIIGGCCGTTPEHIKEIARKIN